MKRLIFPTLLISLGAITGYLIASNGSPNESHFKNHQKVIAVLKSENAMLKAQLEEIEKSREQIMRHMNFSDSPMGSQLTPKNVKAKKSLAAANTDQSYLRILEQKIALIDTESFVRDISQHMERVGYEEFISERQKHFSGEQVEPIWAQAEEEKIHEIFLSTPELADVALVNTECKSSQCRISLAVATTERSNEAIADLSRRLAKDKGNLYHWVSYDPTKNITEVYISAHSRSFNSDGSDATY